MTLLVVVIGRNEGERLRRCLQSVAGDNRVIVYVDSGSTDRSIELARSMGAHVVELDTSRSFTAARARNAGWRCGIELVPSADFVQFVDGDSEVAVAWLDGVAQYLEANASCAAVCGHLRERYPYANVFHRLCAVEWAGPTGHIDACGGIACYRMASLQAVDGFRDDLIAGEEPELCYRLRRLGGTITRLDHEMAVHDASMNSFSQWWNRAVRAGHAYAEGKHLTRHDPRGLWKRENRSIWFWAGVVPVAALGLAWPTRGWSLLILLGYLILWLRIVIRNWSGLGFRTAAIYGTACVIAKFAQLVGVIRFHLNRMTSPAHSRQTSKPLSASLTGGGI